MYTYCLFCETAKCGFVASIAQQLFPCRAIYPKQMQHTWSRGKMVDIEHDLLPGYVFLYAEQEPLNHAALLSLQGVIRCLCSQDNQFELAGSDHEFAMMLLRKDGIIGKTKVYQEGQKVRICKGAFFGVEAKILQISRRNRRMKIELPFEHSPVKTWVEYEMVDSDGPSEEERII